MNGGNARSLLWESRDLLRLRPFALFIASRFASGTALMLLRATIVWQVARLSGDDYYLLALLGLAFFVPTLVLNLFTGAFADTHDRRRTVMGAQVLAVAAAAVLALLSARGAIAMPLLYGMAMLVAVAGAFENPARIALLPQLVPREKFPAAVMFHSLVQLLAFLTGPVLAGFAIAASWSGEAGSYALHVLLTLTSIALMGLVVPLTAQGEPRGISLQSIAEGLRFVWERKIVLACMSLDMFAVIFGSAVALLPKIATDVLGKGPKEYGLLGASLELGSVVMSALLLARPQLRRTGRALIIAVVCYGVFTSLFGLSDVYLVSCFIYMGVGMADAVSVVLRSTMIQLATPDELRGRVSSINMIFIGSSNQLGLVQAGLMAQATGSPSLAVIIGGALATLIAIATAFLIPELWRHRRE